MTETTTRQPGPTSDGMRPVVVDPTPRGFGWIFFAAIVMVLSGVMQAFYGLIAVVNDEWVVWGNQNALYLDLTAWGWIHLIMGTVVALCGVGLVSGNILARFVGIVVASVSLVTNFLFIPAYPLWSLIVIAVDIMVIWAIAVHGGEMRDAR